MHLIAYGKAMPVVVYRLVLSRRSKLGLAMRLTTILLLGVCLHVSAGTMSQVTLSEKNVPLQTVFKKIREQTGYTFVYRNDWLQETHPVTIDVNNVSLRTVLDLCFKGQPFTWEAVRNTIVLRRKETDAALPLSIPAPPPVIRGKVIDEKGMPVAGASVVVKGTKTGVMTKADGSFEIDAGNAEALLTVSFVGFETRSIKIREGQPLTITLSQSDTNMQDMVVTGIVNRRKESFTGAAVSFSQVQLKAIGNQNVIQSLRSLDPSFILTENNTLGSNPNQLPEIEIRGKTSIPSRSLQNQFAADPNQPLFIMDGFETTLRAVLDLDLNRIESVTLLKDAASTAIYGARAANGVVVIETRRPKAGAMQLYYSGDFKLDMPDLSGYNLMNGEEKLEFERLSGRYIIKEPAQIEEQLELDSLYATRLLKVRRGVNTYWLNEPVQPGFSQAHSIRGEGGDAVTSYAAGLQYRTTDGVLKGSGRNTWQGNIDLTYRKNRINVLNKLFVNGYTANESPYGSFSNFARANPYYEKYNEEGGVNRYLEVSKNRLMNDEYIFNPLYDALLNNLNQTTSLSFQNSLQLNYRLNPDLELRGAVQLNKGNSEQTIFFAPEHSMFLNAGQFEKGSYEDRKIATLSYQANAMLTYGHLFNGLHQVTGNARIEIQEDQSDLYATKSVGFPPGTNGNPAFAYGYQPDARPVTAYSQFRRNNFLVSGSYTYDKRWVADFSYRMDGSTAFGSNKKYSPFWSAGIAWNLHNERFFRDKTWISMLRLKANTGATGNQNFSQITSVSVYTYESLLNLFGQGLTLSTLGNPNLAWQNTQQTNLGLDFSFFKGRLGGFVNAFQKYTDPLIALLDLPSSTGLYAYPKNVGHLNNKGIEVNLRYAPVYRPTEGLVWNIGVTGIIQQAIYGGLSNELKGLDKTEQNDRTLLRFRDGYSPEDLWAVYSLGIDPGSGREVFRKLDGSLTFDHDPADESRVGSSRPLVEGVINSNFSWKGLSVGVVIRYRYGGDVFNTALYSKVENISDRNVYYNQDKRALYDRWKKVGDEARFKAISITATTPISSRFVQEDNMLTGESIRVGYDFSKAAFIKKLGMRSLSINGYLNDVFRVSTIRRERGTDYPFARTMALSINTSF